ncbi:hypothetical protein [Pseudochryseolinea flava]|uniref:Uncharacterized protein n=1 Tax=Pseudochryseolinea flava TaxID=2059302 RepID=A0A364Y047_9BACT|nr:hypothetical protein [Pseudochryseolinea flava]RAW00152.1 hypothetical protein DQQ10_16520 [Pseudochryseolinea flava]
MKFLLFSTSILALSCAAPYKALKSVPVDQTCVDKFRPQGIATSWYSAGVDVVGKHLSGLLLIKQMPDESQRVVFTSETGVTFFDFEFKAGTFQVKQAIPQLRRKVVINTLRKDFETLLAIPFQQQTIDASVLGDESFYGVTTIGEERAFFVTDDACSVLKRVEVGSKKPLFSIVSSGASPREPETIAIQHHTFNMVINLKKITRHVTE